MASENWRRQVGEKMLPLESGDVQCLYAADGRRVKISGKIHCNFNINGLTIPFTVLIVPNLSQKLIIGQDMLQFTRANIDYSTNTVSFYDDLVQLNILNDFKTARNIVRISKTCRIPARSEAIIQAFSSNNEYRGRYANKCYIMEALPTQVTKPYLLARTITVPRHSQVLCRIINPTDTSIRFYRRQPIAQLHEINEQDIMDLPEDFTDLDLHAPVVNHLSEAPPLQTEPQNVQQGSKQTTTASTPTTQPVQTKLQQLGITINNENLTADENQKLRDLLEKNADIFATSMADLPGMIGYQHHIDTGDCPPIRRRAYSANPTLQREMARQVTEMLNHGLIEESTAPWNSPAFLVKKKTGELRFVVDYRQLNKVVKPTFYPCLQ